MKESMLRSARVAIIVFADAVRAFFFHRGAVGFLCRACSGYCEIG